jgi:hypothetical protein
MSSQFNLDLFFDASNVQIWFDLKFIYFIFRVMFYDFSSLHYLFSQGNDFRSDW